MRSARAGWLAGSLLLAILGCSAPDVTISPTGSGPRPLVVLNVDGPDLTVRIGDSFMFALPCGAAALTLDPAGSSSLPPLPWSVDFLFANGSVMDQLTYDGTSERRFVTVRDDSIIVGTSLGLGPAPDASACAS